MKALQNLISEFRQLQRQEKDAKSMPFEWIFEVFGYIELCVKLISLFFFRTIQQNLTIVSSNLSWFLCKLYRVVLNFLHCTFLLYNSFINFPQYASASLRSLWEVSVLEKFSKEKVELSSSFQYAYKVFMFSVQAY